MNVKILLFVLVIFMTLQHTLSKKNQGGKKCRGKKKALCAQIASLKAENTALKNTVEDQKQEIEDQKQENEEQKQEIEDLKKKLEDCESQIPPYKSLGCFADTGNRAIPTLEGHDALLDGAYWARHTPIEKCYEAAKKRGYKVFAVQHGGWCASSATAGQTYNKYGASGACAADGEGGAWANQVYEIQG